MKTEIVVSRYNENLDWLKKIKKSKDLKITVYNKGKDDINIPFIPLPNIGRESHTYLYHIINNYDNLADQTIFCQGDSIFHSPGFLELINKHRKKFEPVQPLSAFYWPEGVPPRYEQTPPLPILKETENLWFSKKARVHVEYMNNDFITMYPYHFFDFNIKMYIDRYKILYNFKNPLKFNVDRFKLKNVDLDYLIPFSYSGILSVNKEAIQENSIDFYNNIMSIILYDIRNFTVNKKIDHGYFLERLWLVIFNYKKYNKHYIPLKVKDYVLQNYEFAIKNNNLNFSYFNIYCQLYMKIIIDNTIYRLYISKFNIYLKKNKEFKVLHGYESILNKNIKNIKNILKDNENYDILINFDNNILKIIINNNIIFQYNFDKINIKHTNLKNITIYDIAKYNKLKINNNDTIIKYNFKNTTIFNKEKNDKLKINKNIKTEIVIARYNENLDWLKKIKKSKDLKITVYNKGKNDIDVPFIHLPNIGRESHTYLYHIINNYNNLAEQTIFCQGDSIFHSPGFLELINKHRKKFEPVQPLSAFYWPDGVEPMYLSNPPLPILKETENLWFDKKTPIHVEYMDNNFATLYPFHYIENDFILLNNKIKSSYDIDNLLKFNVERFRLKDVDLDYLFPVCYAALFSISRDAILNNSLDFYNNIMSILIYDIRNYSKDKLMDHGLILEKLWLVIFNYKKYNKNYIPLKIKDYVLQNYEIDIKNNIGNFSYFNIYFQLYMSIIIDDRIYNAFISPRSIYFKMKNYFKMLYNVDAKFDSSIYKLLKDNTQNNILIELKNNILKISVNNNVFIDYNFKNIKHKKLKSITVYDMAKYNNFVDNVVDNVVDNLKK